MFDLATNKVCIEFNIMIIKENIKKEKINLP